MKINNEDFDKVLNKLIASTRSPRGRFSAANSWKLLEGKLRARKRRRLFWLRVSSSAAVVLLCIASWAAYHALRPEPIQPRQEEVHTVPPAPAPQRKVFSFDQQPLHEIARQLSEAYRTQIVITDDSLRNYCMTGTFDNGESLTEILDLLKGAARNFDYKATKDTIIITKLN